MAAGHRAHSHDGESGSSGQSLAVVDPDVRDVAIAIARTEPEFSDRPEVREVEHLLADLLRVARQWIDIETQYFTSAILAEVLAARLQEPAGPEIVLILHPNSDGVSNIRWMCSAGDGCTQKRPRAADRFHRLGLYYPYLPDLKGQCISMHSKVCVVDHEYVRIGSANMSNRSMGFDHGVTWTSGVETPSPENNTVHAKYFPAETTKIRPCSSCRTGTPRRHILRSLQAFQPGRHLGPAADAAVSRGANAAGA